MPQMSRNHSPDASPRQVSSAPTRTDVSRSNSETKEGLDLQDPGLAPGGVLALCMYSDSASASGCVAEGMTAASTHAWIALEPEKGSRESYGFWPDNSSLIGRATGGFSAIVANKGQVKTPDPKDGKGPQVSQRFDVSGEQIDDLRKWIGSNSNWTYSFTMQNCVDWANGAVKAAGQSPTLPDAPGPDPLACPSQSMQWVQRANYAEGIPRKGEEADPRLRGEVEYNHLTVEEKKNWKKLGYDESNWEAGNPALESRSWKDLTKAEREGATSVGYNEWKWDEEEEAYKQ